VRVHLPDSIQGVVTVQARHVQIQQDKIKRR
jgi:hypothetical protein